MITDWGIHQDQKIHLYTLENAWLRVEISDFGAVIRTLFVKDFNQDVVLGYPTLENYIADDKYIGCVIGRNANRIAQGKFTLNQKTFQLNLNSGPNHLHGGITGFDKRVFEAIEVTDTMLTLRYMSPHNEENYPGNLAFTLTFRLDDDSLVLNYHGVCDKKTLFNPTHHSYFNLTGEATIANHELSIDSDRYAPPDCDGLAQYPPHKTIGPMDFSRFARLSTRLDTDIPTIRIAHGLDHHFQRNCDTQQAFIRLRCEDKNLSVFTDSPGAQVYSGNFLDGNTKGKNGFDNGWRSGICIETQCYPNNINNDAPLKGILEAYEDKGFTTRWRFYRKEKMRHE